MTDQDKAKLEEWKKKIKDEWEYRRKLVIFEDSEGNLITPKTTASTTTTTTTKAPVTSKNTSFITSPVVVTNQTSVTPHTGEVVRGDTTELLKIIGITCGALVSIIIVALICIRLCRISARKRKERVSVRRPLNPEPEEHIYAEIEPLQGAASDGPSGASGSGSSGVPLPSKREKRRLRGVSSFRAFSTRIYKWFSTEHSDDNQSVFYNRSAESSSVQNAPEPPSRNTVNGKTRRGKGTGVKRYESQSRRPLLDGDSVISTSSSNVDTRDNVYNPLLREEGRSSGPYDHLRLSKTQSGQVKEPDQEPPQSPHDYFTLEKETADGEQETAGPSVPMENIAEIAEDSQSNDNVIVDIEKALQESEAESSETPKNHEYFILEPTHATIESPTKSSIKSKSSDKDTSAKSTSDTHGETDASVVGGKSEEMGATVEIETAKEPSKSRSPGSGKSKPIPKPRSVSSPTREKTPNSPDYSGSPKKETGAEKTLETSKDRPQNSYTSLGDTLGDKETTKETVNGKDEEYVITKLGDAPKPPMSSGNDNQVEDYLEPIQKKPDYVDVYPNPPPRTTSMAPSKPAPAHSIETDV